MENNKEPTLKDRARLSLKELRYFSEKKGPFNKNEYRRLLLTHVQNRIDYGLRSVKTDDDERIEFHLNQFDATFPVFDEIRRLEN